MSKLAKILIPFVVPNCTSKDFTSNAGFIDLYTKDFDKYNNYTGLYFMYKEKDTEESRNAHINIVKNPGIIKQYTKIIKNTPNAIYNFDDCILKKDDNLYKLIKYGVCVLTTKEKLQILQFWGEYDSITDEILSEPVVICNIDHSVPEQDCLVSFKDYIDKKNQNIIV